MNSWAENLLVSLESASTEKTVFEQIESTARHLGFDQCAYGMRMPLPFTNPRVVMLNNYPPAWQARYAEAGYLAIDPSVLHCRQNQAPLIWSDEVFKDTQALWDDARAVGLNVGWAQSNLDRYGVGGMLTLSRSGEAITDKELADKQLKMRWLTNVAHLALTRVLKSDPQQDAYEPLTTRETDVLKWAADGKTSGEIAEIMTISVNTVNFHVKNAIFKLKSANKTAAVVRAAVLGLLA